MSDTEFDLNHAETLVACYGGDLGIAWEMWHKAQKKWQPDRGAGFKHFWATYYRNQLRYDWVERREVRLPMQLAARETESDEDLWYQGPYGEAASLLASGWKDTTIMKHLGVSGYRWKRMKSEIRSYLISKRRTESPQFSGSN